MNIQAAKEFLLEQFSEPSTWRGLINIMTASGIAIKPELMEPIITVGVLVNGLVGVLTKDRK